MSEEEYYGMDTMFMTSRSLEKIPGVLVLFRAGFGISNI
jgi:hypothetical protein